MLIRLLDMYVYPWLTLGRATVSMDSFCFLPLFLTIWIADACDCIVLQHRFPKHNGSLHDRLQLEIPERYIISIQMTPLDTIVADWQQNEKKQTKLYPGDPKQTPCWTEASRTLGAEMRYNSRRLKPTGHRLLPFYCVFSFSFINNKQNASWANEMMLSTTLEFPDNLVIKVGVTNSISSNINYIVQPSKTTSFGSICV